MDYKEFTMEINRTFVVKFTDSLGKKKLVDLTEENEN